MLTKETADAVAFYANIATFVALALTAIGLFVAARQLSLGRKAASAAAFIALNESLRQAWLHFSTAEEAKKQYAFADVMNLLESACAMFDEKIFVGKVGALLEDYLCHIFILIQESDDARARIEPMMLTDKSFEHIVKFLRQHRKCISRIQLPGLVWEEDMTSQHASATTAVMRDLFDRWELVWHEDRHELIPACVAPAYLRHEAAGDRIVTPESYALELEKLKVDRPGVRVAVYDHLFQGNRAWFRFMFKWGDPKTRETVTQAGMQSYRTENGKLAETWIMLQPIGSKWSDPVAQQRWTSPPPQPND